MARKIKALVEQKRLTNEQLLAVGLVARKFMNQKWFDYDGKWPTQDRFMTLLLLNVYLSSRADKPLHKKAAWKTMGVEDIKTGRKYIAEAERFGLIEAVQSSEDKRKELLRPTARLSALMERELRNFGADLWNAAFFVFGEDEADKPISPALENSRTKKAEP
jgi:hypothetical protein